MFAPPFGAGELISCVDPSEPLPAPLPPPAGLLPPLPRTDGLGVYGSGFWFEIRSSVPGSGEITALDPVEPPSLAELGVLGDPLPPACEFGSKAPRPKPLPAGLAVCPYTPRPKPRPPLVAPSISRSCQSSQGLEVPGLGLLELQLSGSLVEWKKERGKRCGEEGLLP